MRRCFLTTFVFLAIIFPDHVRCEVSFQSPPVQSQPSEETRARYLEISRVFTLDGVADYSADLAKRSYQKIISTEGVNWICDSVAEAMNKKRRGESSGDIFAIFKQNEEMRVAVRDAIRKKVRTELPKLMSAAISEGLFQASGNDEAMQIANRSLEFLSSPMNDTLDNIGNSLFEKYVDAIDAPLSKTGYLNYSDLTNLRKTLTDKLNGKLIDATLTNQFAKAVGAETAEAIRSRIATALSGELPPEVVSALKAGPEKFDEYLSSINRYLPSTALNKLENSILNKGVLKLPTPAYAAMLAGSAAGHFAKAFKGVFVDPYELKRGCEVIRVMTWQIKNKKAVNLNIMQLSALTGELSELAGLNLPLDDMLSNVKDRLDEIEKIAGEIEGDLKKPLEDVSAHLRKVSEGLIGQLTSFQNAVIAPAREFAQAADNAMSAVGAELGDILPENFNGLPANFSELKELAGLEEDTLGKLGEKNPAELLAETLSLEDAAKKISRDVSDIADAISDTAGNAASGVLYAAHLIGPAAAILDVEKIPDVGVSESDELDPVILSNGEYISRVTDFVIPSAVSDIKFTRIYRARSEFNGEFGWKWTHSYAERLLPWKDGLTYVDENALKHFYRKVEDGYVAENIFLPALRNNDNGYELESRDGLKKKFDAEGKLTAICRGELCLKLHYDKGMVSELIDAYGRKLQFQRRNDGLITSIVDFAGRTFRYLYNDKGELTSVFVPSSSAVAQAAYIYTSTGKDMKHLLSQAMDAKGYVYLKNEYDEKGRVVLQKYGQATSKIDYQSKKCAAKSCAIVTNVRGGVKLYEHDEVGRLLRESRVADEKKIEIYFAEYDEQGRIEKECREDECEKFYYEGLAELPSQIEKSKNGIVVSSEKIKRERGTERPLEVKFSAGEVAKFEYSPFNFFEPSKVVSLDVSGKQKLIEESIFSKCGKPVYKKSQSGEEIELTYYPTADPLGRGVQGSSSNGNDSCGYLKFTRSHSTGESKNFFYDAYGNLSSLVSSKTGEVRFFVSPSNKLLEESRSNGKIRYIYDANDNISETSFYHDGKNLFGLKVEREYLDDLISTAIYDRDGEYAKTNYIYDASGGAYRVKNPDGSEDAFELYDDGSVKCELRGYNSIDVQKKCFSHETLRNDEDALIAANKPVNAYCVKVERDFLGRITGVYSCKSKKRLYEFQWDKMNRLSLALSLNGDEYSFEYDAAGRISVERFPNETERSFSYDESGLVRGIVERDGTAILITRDDLGRMIKREAVSGVNENSRIVQEFSYDEIGNLKLLDANLSLKNDVSQLQKNILSSFDPDGNVRTVQLGKFLTMQEEFDFKGRVASKTYVNDKQVELFRFEYRRGDDGRASEVDLPYGVIRKIKRDELGRIVEATDHGSKNNKWSYTWDDDSIMLDAKKNAKFDTAGRLVEFKDKKFVYDALGRLISVLKNNEALADFEYDDLNRVVRVKTKTKDEKIIWQDWFVEGKVSSDGAETRYLYSSDFAPAAVADEKGVRYFVSDSQDSVYALTNDRGEIIKDRSFSPFGETISENFSWRQEGFEPCFAGGFCDDSSGLVYLRNRFYLPELGAFITPDPLGLKLPQRNFAGPVISPEQSFHRLQGQAGRNNFPFVPSEESGFAAPLFSRLFTRDEESFSPELGLYSFAYQDPTEFSDFFGLASLVFDRSDSKMYLYDGKENFVTEYLASNRTINPSGDPIQIGSNGPAPNGTFTIKPPEFYSEEYRDSIYKKFGFDAPKKGEGVVNGQNWANAKNEKPDYHTSFGRIRFRVGSPKTETDYVAWKRQLFIHGGRRNYLSKTKGCVRADDAELETLTANFIAFMRQGDPINSLTVRE